MVLDERDWLRRNFVGTTLCEYTHQRLKCFRNTWYFKSPLGKLACLASV